MPGVDPKTAEDFLTRNSTAQPLASDMDLGTPYTLLTPADRSRIFSQNQDGWQVFYEMYPDAPGITNLSRAAFNATFTQSLVYIGTLSNWHSGEGYFLLLITKNGIWMVDKQVMTWIS